MRQHFYLFKNHLAIQQWASVIQVFGCLTETTKQPNDYAVAHLQSKTNLWNLIWITLPDSKVYGPNMGPTWVLSAPDGPHVGPMILAIRELSTSCGVTASVRTLVADGIYKKGLMNQWPCHVSTSHGLGQLHRTWDEQISPVVMELQCLKRIWMLKSFARRHFEVHFLEWICIYFD